MATLTKLSTAKPTNPRVTRRTVPNVLRAHQGALQDQIEDAQLNAIADERADGPFVKVSLDEL